MSRYRVRVGFVLLGAVLLGACGPRTFPPASDALAGSDSGTDSGVIIPGALAVTPASGTVEALMTVAFAVTGGTGPYWATVQAGEQPSHGGTADGSDLTFDGASGTGSYTAGDLGNVTDVIRIGDAAGASLMWSVSVTPLPPGAGIDPSGGSGGACCGAQSRMTTYAGQPVDYALYIPTSYDPTMPIALVSLFHGQGDTGSNMRDFWSTTAENNGFVVLATSNTGASGGWNPGVDVPRYDAALTDTLGAYNIEQARLYVWGFSAGAHLAHGIGLQNADYFAAYSVSAGALDAFAGASAPAMAVRRIPVDIHIGDTDPLFPAAMTDRTRFINAGWVDGMDLSWMVFSGGHTVLSGHPQEVWDFLGMWVRP